MRSSSKYIRVFGLALILIVILVVLGLDEDQTVINGVKHFLKAVLRAL